MASRVTYQNISPEVTRKPWSVMSPDAEYDICYVTFLNKTKSNKMEYTARRFFISFYNSAPLFTLFSNGDMYEALNRYS